MPQTTTTRSKGKAKEILRAEVSDVRQIATILKTVNIHSETKATITVQDDGLSFNVEVGQTVLARAHLHNETNFRSYVYNPPLQVLQQQEKKDKDKGKGKKKTRSASSDTEPGTDEDNEEEEEVAPAHVNGDGDEGVPPMSFEISLSALLNCLNIFGDTTVKPVSARQQAAREKWKTRQGNGSNGGAGGGDRPQYGRRYGRDEDEDDEDGNGDDGPQLRDEALFQRDSRRAGSTVTGTKKKANVAMVLSWQAEGCPLVLLLEDNGIVTRCEISTFEASDIFDLPYDDDERVQKLILNSSWLSEALSEIDSSCERVTLRFRPPGRADQSYETQAGGTNGNDGDDDDQDEDNENSIRSTSKAAFSLEAKSNTGSVEMDYPFTREVLEVCECERSMRNSYKFSHLSYIRQALLYSTKTSLRTDSSGIISMQFMIVNANAPSGNDTSGVGFVEFTCMPLNDDD